MTVKINKNKLKKEEKDLPKRKEAVQRKRIISELLTLEKTLSFPTNEGSDSGTQEVPVSTHLTGPNLDRVWLEMKP